MKSVEQTKKCRKIASPQITAHISLRRRRLEVVGTRKNGRARRRHASGEVAPLACLPRACSFSLSPTTSKRLLRRLSSYFLKLPNKRNGATYLIFQPEFPVFQCKWLVPHMSLHLSWMFFQTASSLFFFFRFKKRSARAREWPCRETRNEGAPSVTRVAICASRVLLDGLQKKERLLVV